MPAYEKTGYAEGYLLIDDKECIFIENHRFTGRKVIYSSETEINENTIPEIINGAMNRHEQNCHEIEYLERHFTEDQPVLKRIKHIRPDVNNKIVINNAYSIVRNANGYFLGEPIKYASKDAQCRDEVEVLNNMMDGINKACGDTQIGEWVIKRNNADSNTAAISEESLYRVFLRALNNAPNKTATFIAMLNNKVIAKEVIKEQNNQERRCNPIKV